MPKASPLQSSFSGGEYSPLLYGRVDADRYKTGLAVCKNYVPLIQGPLTRRPGTFWVSECKDSTKAARLVEFEYSTEQAYIIEFGDNYIRFYRDNAQVLEAAKNIVSATNASPCVVTVTSHGFSNGNEVFVTGVGGMTQVNGRNFIVAGVTTHTFQLADLQGNLISTAAYGTFTSGGTVSRVYTVATSYDEADLFALNFNQSEDVLYITHTGYPPTKLTRTADTSWTLTEIDFLDGPYLPENITTTTISFSAASGSITVTASAALFASTDVGRLIRSKQGGNWSWLEITAFSSSTQVTATVKGPNVTSGAAHLTYRLGLWSGTTGYPAVSTFHEDRLGFGGTLIAPQRLDLSETGDYESFSPTEANATVIDSNALSFTLNSNDVNVIRWMISAEKGLLVGTVAGEWAVKSSANGEALTPSSIKADQVGRYGSALVTPIAVGSSVLFLQRSGRKLREMAFSFEEDSFRSQDRTVLSEHITGATGVKQMAFQKEQQAILWLVRNDGVLVGMTYERDQDTLIIGWHRHIIGGYSDAAQSAAVVESVAIIPSPDGTREDVWLIVRRTIDGVSKRYIEYMTKFFEDTDEQSDAFFVDCGLTYDNPLTITSITQDLPATATATSHGFSNGNAILLSGILGMTELNGKTVYAANVSANTFQITDEDGNFIDTRTYGAYVSGGQARKYINTVQGLWHLEGETVDVLGDGAVQPSTTVANGSVTLSSHSTTVHIGFGYESDAQMLRLEAGAADGTSLGKVRRTHQVGFLLHRSLGLKIGTSFDNLTELTFRVEGDPETRPPQLFSGIRRESFDADYDFDNQVCWRTDTPLPSTILAVAPKLHTQDAA
jgi:hypothetical protein